MGLHYKIQQPVPIFGTKNATTFALTEIALTASLADNRKVIAGTAGMSKLDLRYSYTSGTSESNNSINILVEESSDRVNWFKIANESVSAGTSTLTARTFVNADNTGGATNILGSLGLDIFYDNIRVSVSETGEAAVFGTVYMEGTILGL